MKYRLLPLLACPKCRASKFVLETFSSHKQKIWNSHFTHTELQQTTIDGVDRGALEEEEIDEGKLHCSHCSASYDIMQGIPRMVLADTKQDKRSTGHKHTRFDNLPDISVWEKNFQYMHRPLGISDFLGKKVLDIGCGYGRHAYFAAKYGAEVIAIDIHEDAVLMTKENTADFQHVHVIQADASYLPIRDVSMDRVYAFGILHHTPNSEEIMEHAHRTLVSGGSMSFWVYGPRQGLTLFVNNALRGATTNMNHEELLGFSKVIARILRIGSHMPYKAFRHVPLGHSIVSHLPLHDHHRWPFDIVVADIYDRLRVPVLRWFEKDDLEKWFIAHGYISTDVQRIIRNNETLLAFGVKR